MVNSLFSQFLHFFLFLFAQYFLSCFCFISYYLFFLFYLTSFFGYFSFHSPHRFLQGLKEAKGIAHVEGWIQFFVPLFTSSTSPASSSSSFSSSTSSSSSSSSTFPSTSLSSSPLCTFGFHFLSPLWHFLPSLSVIGYHPFPALSVPSLFLALFLTRLKFFLL